MPTQPASDLFDASVRESQEWVDDVARETGLDRRYALHALRAVLHAIRDETTARQSGHFVSEMPALIRGFYFEGWDPSRAPVVDHDARRFVERIRPYFADYDGELDLGTIVRGVFRVLHRRMPGPAAKIVKMLPKELHALWPTETIAEETAERHTRIVTEERIATLEALHADHGHERGAPMAPHQNRPPGEQHRGGPLPNTM